MEYLILDSNWDDYVKRVKASNTHKERLNVLSKARELLGGVRFLQLSYQERIAISGGVKFQDTRGSLGKDLSKYEWAFFGSTFAAGYLKRAIRQNHPNISSALDRIDSDSPVSRDSYEEFVSLFSEAFRETGRPNQFAGATRLLAMKRPDQFICITNENREALNLCLGYSKSFRLGFENYWQKIIEPIMKSRWWQSPRPTEHVIYSQMWDGRAAMLDAMLYRQN